MMKRKGWELAPTIRSLATLARLADELGYPTPAPATRGDARKLLLGYQMEKRKREGNERD